jgi:phosphoribosylaminoimidazole carboxylase (NCAIR synthetase)
MDNIFDWLQKVIHHSMMMKAVKFNYDGAGQPYLFASEKDVAAVLKKQKSGMS